jgi:hypothetical protein
MRPIRRARGRRASGKTFAGRHPDDVLQRSAVHRLDAFQPQVQDDVHGGRQDETRAARGEGTWKLSKDGFCTTWKGAKDNCFTVVSAGDNKWSVLRGSTIMATWSK